MSEPITEQEWLGNTPTRVAVASSEPIDIFDRSEHPTTAAPLYTADVEYRFDPRDPRRRHVNYTVGSDFPNAAVLNLYETMVRHRQRLQLAGIDAVFFLNGEQVNVRGI